MLDFEGQNAPKLISVLPQMSQGKLISRSCRPH